EMTDMQLTLPNDLEIEMRREFAASAQVIFDMWTKPEHVRRWYGVRGTTVTVCDIDLRVGGAWRWVVERGTMVAGFSGVFVEIDAPRRLQRTEMFEQMPGKGSVVTLTFEEQDGRTTLAVNMRFETKQDRDMTLKTGMEHGVRECFANIDAIVAGLVSA